MKIEFVENFPKRGKGDLLIVPYWEQTGLASNLHSLAIDRLLKSNDFKGKIGETALLYPEDGPEARILLLGLGHKKEITHESLRRSYAAAVKVAREKRVHKVHLLFPEISKLPLAEAIQGVFEGIFLTSYAFCHLKGDTLKDNPPIFLDHLSISGLSSSAMKQIERLQKISSAVCFARDLVNGNADDIHPGRLAKEALAFGKGIKTVVLEKKELEKEGLGLLLAVGRAAKEGPKLISCSYRGNSKSKETIVLVGKGITYDTGGLCLKSPDNMMTMKCDMAGAATVLSVVKLARDLDLKINVTALAPVAENAIGSGSYKLGDVYRACNGKTVEILNTDAEGRLVLADAIAYAVKKCNPSCIIDIGTLTGGIVLALGEEISGLFSKDEAIVQDLQEASVATGENIWRLPLYDYRESLRSEIADIANLGGRDAGSMKCALFIGAFADDVPWAHIDMAGPAYISKPKHYNPTKATGWGVRLLLKFLEKRQ